MMKICIVTFAENPNNLELAINKTYQTSSNVDQLGTMRLWLTSLLVSSLLISSSICSDSDKSDGEDDEVIVVHDTWEKGDAIEEVEVEEGVEGQERLDNVKTVKFTLDDAVVEQKEELPQPPPVNEPPAQESEEVRKAREMFEEAEVILKSGSLDKRSAWEMIEKAALADYSPAILKLAWAYLLGNRFHINPKAAHTLFTSLAETGDPEAQMGMAFLYATGSVVNSSQSQALLYYTFGAFGGSHWAQMALGYRYWSGMGVATSCEKVILVSHWSMLIT